MVHHIVMFRLEGEESAVKAAANEFRTKLEALPQSIEQLKSIEVHLNDAPIDSNWTLMLHGVCKDYDDLATYSAHPDHLACVAIIKPLVAGRACVDYLD